MSEDTAPRAMTGAESLALVKTSALRKLGDGMLVHGETRISPAHYLRPDGVCPACAVGTYLNATADALEALREAVKGCGKIIGVNYSAIGTRCGEICTGRRSLCFRCATNRDAAINRLLGTTDNGGVG